MLQNLEKFKELWGSHRGRTLDLLKILSDDDLSFRVGNNMGTLGQQFRHLSRVDDQYITAIETKKVENNRKKLDFPIETSVTRLLDQFETNEKRLYQVLENTKEDVEINWEYWEESEFTLIEHLEAMIEHEILHHGELIVYFHLMNKKFPDSWSAWGL